MQGLQACGIESRFEESNWGSEANWRDENALRHEAGRGRPAAMQRYLIERGVSGSRIIVDNTLATARRALACRRAQLAFSEQGHISALARTLRLIDFYSAWREVPAYAVYRVWLAMNPLAARNTQLTVIR